MLNTPKKKAVTPLNAMLTSPHDIRDKAVHFDFRLSPKRLSSNNSDSPSAVKNRLQSPNTANSAAALDILNVVSYDAVLSSYESLIKSQRSQLFNATEEKDSLQKKYNDLLEEYTKYKDVQDTKLLESQTILAITKKEINEKLKKAASSSSSIMSDQIRLKGLLLDLSSRLSLSSSSSSLASSIFSSAIDSPSPKAGNALNTSFSSSSSSLLELSSVGGGGKRSNVTGSGNNLGYYQSTKLSQELDEIHKILSQINQSYQRLERNLYELFRQLPSSSSSNEEITSNNEEDEFFSITNKESIDLFQTINQQNNSISSLKKKCSEKTKKLSEENSNLMKQNILYKNNLSELNHWKLSFSYHYQQLQQAESSLKEENSQIKKEFQEIKEKFSDVNKQLSLVDHQYNTEKLSNEVLIRKNHDLLNCLKEENVSLEKEKISLKQTIEEIQHSLKLHENENHSLTERMKQYELLIQQYEEEKNRNKNSYEKELLIKDNYIQQLSIIIKKHKEEKNTYSLSLTTLQNSLQEEKQSLLEEITRMTNQSSLSETSIKTLMLQLSELQSSYETLKNEKNHLESSLSTKIDYIKSVNTKLEEQIKEKIEEMKEINQKNNSQTLQLYETKQEYSILSSQYQQQTFLLENIKKDSKNDKSLYSSMIHILLQRMKSMETSYSQLFFTSFISLLEKKVFDRIEKFSKIIPKITSSIASINHKQRKEIKYYKQLIIKVNDDYEEQVKQLQSTISEEKEKKQKKEMEMIEKNQQLFFQEQRFIAVEEEKTSCLLSIELLKKQINEFVLSLSVTDSSMKELSLQYDELQIKKAFCEETILSLQLTIDDLSSKNILFQNSEKLFLEKQKLLKNQIHELTTKYELSLITIKKEYNEKIEQMEKEKNEKDILLKETLEKMNLLKKKNDGKNQMITELSQKNVKLKEKLISYQKEYEKQDNDLINQIGKFSNEILSIHLQLNDLNSVVSNNDSGIDLVLEEERKFDGNSINDNEKNQLLSPYLSQHQLVSSSIPYASSSRSASLVEHTNQSTPSSRKELQAIIQNIRNDNNNHNHNHSEKVIDSDK
jgi:chromosome segregation ATPase